MNIFLFDLKFSGRLPLYRQLYLHIIQEIKAGRIQKMERLPSKRSLAAYLNISLRTVETAYDMLAAEGYIKSRPRSGFYVCDIDLLLPVSAEEMPPAEEPEEEPRQYFYDFSTGDVDTSVFPYASWAKLSKEVIYQNPQLLSRGDMQGDSYLRKSLAKVLHELRGVNCGPEQIIIGAGMEYLLDLIIQVLDKSSVFALENPGYDKTWRIIENNGRKILPVPLDKEGMRADRLEQSGANVAYITPSHQFPLGITMPVGRRAKLLRWALEASDRYLIEDDYDSEFRYGAKPVPALQSWDVQGKVIYAGTFSRSIAPSIRVAYLVLPPRLLQLCREKFRFYSSTVSRFEQHTLARFLDSGQYVRHLNRVGNLYKQKRAALLAEFMKHPAEFKLSGSHAGLHLLVRAQNGMSETQMVEYAKKAGLKVYGLSNYFEREKELCPPSTVVLGYAGIPLDNMRDAAEKLISAWRK